MRKIIIRPLLLILLLTLVLPFPLLVNPALLTRSDAVVQIGITNAILRDGLPPSNPFLAGERLHYYWFYNALVAALTRISGIRPAVIMALLNPIGLFILLSMVYLSTGQLARAEAKNSSGLLAVILVAFGLNGWGWLFLTRPVLQGGLPALRPILTGGVWRFLSDIAPTKWAGTMGFMATKFLVANSFSLSLAAISVALYALFKFLQSPRIKSAALFFGATVFSSYLNLIAAGGFLIICTFFFLFWLILSAVRPEYNRKISLYGLALVFLTLLATAPYIASMIDSSFAWEKTLTFQSPDLSKLILLAVILFPLWLSAVITFRKNEGAPNPAARIFLIVALILLGAGFLFLGFLKQNEFKLPFLLAIFLSVFVGRNAAFRRPKTARLVWIIALTTLPTTLLGLIAYSHEPLQIKISDEETAAYAWIRNRAPKDAVVISEVKSDLIPLLAQRDAYLACQSFLNSSPENRKLVGGRKTTLRKLRREINKRELLKSISAELSRPVVLVSYDPDLQFPRELTPLSSFGEIRLWYLPHPFPAEGD